MHMNCVISFSLVTKHVFDSSTKFNVSGFLSFAGNFRASDVHTISSTKCGATGNFRASDVRTISSTKCGAFRFLQEIFVHRTYVPWLTDNTGARSGSPQLTLNITFQITFLKPFWHSTSSWYV